MKKWMFSTLLLLFILPAGLAQPLPKVEKELRRYISALTDDEMAGRASQTRGDTLAAEYLRDFLAAQKEIKLLYDNGIQRFSSSSWAGQLSSFNVAGLIEGRDPVLKHEIILIGAHYDHMGIEEDNWGDEPKIKHGADDNASGTAMVMALARHLADERKLLKRSVMIVFFGAEECGLVGSAHMAQNLPEGIAAENIACMVNFDMVGRLTPERGLTFFGLNSGLELNSLLRSVPSPMPNGTPVHFKRSVFASSDHSSFYDQGIPAFMVFTGIHADYHKSTDTPDKINFRGMSMIYPYTKSIILKLSNGPRITFQNAE
ncbi:M20/M25/M40 family metallo-hydrolase [Alistipes sp. OttesenSCG-928-L06]|nr:M20/M25/M40 family metallo-hydrolase [Alistipes sp. OttesenSCG-928-L06]